MQEQDRSEESVWEDAAAEGLQSLARQLLIWKEWQEDNGVTDEVAAHPLEVNPPTGLRWRSTSQVILKDVHDRVDRSRAPPSRRPERPTAVAVRSAFFEGVLNLVYDGFEMRGRGAGRPT